MTSNRIPTLYTDRLCLRPFRRDDGPLVRLLAGEYDVAYNVLAVPHPYPEGAAEAWIETHPAEIEQNRGLILALTRREDGVLLGSMGLHFDVEQGLIELGYWVGVPYWGQGYATEAGRAMRDLAFSFPWLEKLYGRVFTRNPASAAVLRKLGMVPEGVLRKHLVRFEERVDVEYYGLMRAEWEILTRG